MQFEFDSETGVIKDKLTGERCLIITQTRVAEICKRLSEIFQSGAELIIFEAGKAAGKNFVEKRPEATKVDKTTFLKMLTQRFTDAGLGKIEIVEFDAEKAAVTFRIYNNFFAELGCNNTNYRSCIEGFVSGIYEHVMSITPKIKKMKCIANGDPYCEWHTTLK